VQSESGYRCPRVSVLVNRSLRVNGCVNICACMRLWGGDNRENETKREREKKGERACARSYARLCVLSVVRFIAICLREKKTM